MTTSPILMRSLRWGGSAIAVTGIVFVTLRLHDHSNKIDFSHFDNTVWMIVAIFALLYGLSNLMIALGWRNLLGQFNVNTTRCRAIRIYGITQIAKYVPGNIFHLAGRQTMGLAAGMPAWPLAKSAVWELGVFSAVAGLFGLLAIPLIRPNCPMEISVGLFITAMGLAFFILLKFFGHHAARALIWYSLFFLVSSILFAGLTILFVNQIEIELWLLIPMGGAYVVAWLIGLITPGAPAGIGVRELVLLFLLNGTISEVDLFLIVAIGRIISVIGDLIFFTICVVLLHDRVLEASQTAIPLK